MNIHFFSWFLASFLFHIGLSAQAQPINTESRASIDAAIEYVKASAASYGLTSSDVNNMEVSHQYVSKNSGLHHIYLQQGVDNLPVYNAIMGVHVTKDGEIFHVDHTFIPQVYSKLSRTTGQVSATEAVNRVAQHLGITGLAALRAEPKKADGRQFFELPTVSSDPIIVEKMWYALPNTEEVREVWDVSINPTDGRDHWSIRIDAATAEVLDQQSYTTHCHFDHDSDQSAANSEHLLNGYIYTSKYEDISVVKRNETVAAAAMSGPDGASYNVYPLPLESPTHGERSIVTDPAHPVYSPHGWHDTNGVDGAEFQITRGNNVHAFETRSTNVTSTGNEPNGGASLVFDYPFDQTAEPEAYTDAAVTNLFYMTNMMHDISEEYGLTPEAGSFQANNYGGLNVGEGDPVQAYAQFGASGIEFRNNADFSTPPDGSSPTVRMFLWTRAQAVAGFLEVNEPASVAGVLTTGTADFGPAITDTPIVGEVAIVDDGTNKSTFACAPIQNGDQINGKIALVDRGDCFFADKVYAAQLVGAIGVIICNYDDNTIGMAGGGDNFSNVTISSVSISSSDCNRIRAVVDQGLEITLVEPEGLGADELDGSFENGIIGHEYGHGISNRLTGGASESSCLFQDEQMGEGWSDFMSLITATKAGDTGATPRPIGVFTTREEVNGRGIRSYPYSTDMAINPLTYDDILVAFNFINGQTEVSVHSVGEVWCAMLWDLYWAMAEKYEYDPNIFNGTGGNNMAIKLVFEGMSLQNCNPGFVNGRDAILLADKVMNDGANECLIWEVFARRGLGVSASQGSQGSISDGVESYDTPKSCAANLDITKTVTPLINAGDVIEVSLFAANYKADAVQGVRVQDQLPSGVTADNISSGGSQEGDMVVWDLGVMSPGDEMSLTYSMNSPSENFSRTIFSDGFEEDQFANWDLLTINDNPNVWSPVPEASLAYEGEWFYLVGSVDEVSEQVLALNAPLWIQGDKPTLRFWHNYESEASTDAGIVEISTDGGSTWEDLGSSMFRNPYRGLIRSTVFGPARRLEGFWGNSLGYVETFVDLSAYRNTNALIRYHFSTDGNTAVGLGWSLDNIEVMDMYNYDTEACITSEGGDETCALAPERGTVVNAGGFVSNEETSKKAIALSVFPNPSADMIQLSIEEIDEQELFVSIIDAAGRVVQRETVKAQGGSINHSMNIGELSAGFYFVKLTDRNNEYEAIRKIVVR